jgi:hypothetical protein
MRSAAEVEAALGAVGEQGQAKRLTKAISSWRYQLETVKGHIQECLADSGKFPVGRYPDLDNERRLLLDECRRVGAMADEQEA